MIKVLITYDVSTQTSQGKKRLSRVAKKCEDYGQRVQNSVFECLIDWALYVRLKSELVKLVNLKEDSIRFYILGKTWEAKTEHFGVKRSVDPSAVIII